MRTGYSYLHYSSDQQGGGESIRRQTVMAKDWCDRNKLQLDITTTFTDRGKSAFRGKHRLTGALGVFLADVEAGRIPEGSVLIIENPDRLSREDEYEATNLLTSLVIAGISIVTNSPRETVYEKGSNNLGSLGELQPRTNGRKRDGEPIVDYYPAVIDEGTWAQAQQAIAGHKRVVGKPRGSEGGLLGEKSRRCSRAY
jgi:hypothetical protein